jgi:hypothetical protein
MIQNIQILTVERHSKTASTGSGYIQLEVAFKNLDKGAVESRKIMPFGKTATVHKTLNEAQPGSQWVIEMEKGEKYWDWIKATPKAPGSPTAAPNKPTGTPVGKSTYETPEERAFKQRLIVRQSSLSVAKDVLAIGAKAPPSLVALTDLSEALAAWVFKEPNVSLVDMENDLTFEEEDVT